ncbi:GNAT family N-acetyltransferase [Methylonatrum kenyense]|uniref:GNAT family N-acetyltransferase n=1 Tax=Methylonatrum kenyense TaxID=455253 RepID=UPI0020C04DD4|nr:GNAT family N-acetyltransferase [Methylonatrum kenyense]MCK8515538.1 GNAT family N-acetyltransferase [Methylonatrum kenyense]
MPDLAALVDLEQRCFPGDRISRRGFRHMLTRGNAHLLVVDEAGQMVACLVLLFRRGSSVARLYSIAVHPRRRGTGLAARLVHAAEREARRRGAGEMRLEVRADNQPSQKLFSRLGYACVARSGGYYSDGTAALRFRRRLEALNDGCANVP